MDKFKLALATSQRRMGKNIRAYMRKAGKDMTQMICCWNCSDIRWAEYKTPRSEILFEVAAGHVKKFDGCLCRQTSFFYIRKHEFWRSFFTYIDILCCCAKPVTPSKIEQLRLLCWCQFQQHLSSRVSSP